MSTKRQPQSVSVGGRTQVRRDENGRWHIVHLEDDEASTTSHAKPQKQAQDVHIVEEDGAYEDWETETDSASLPMLEASEAFLTLEDRIAEEGYTPELVDELVRVGDTQSAANQDPETADDWAFAVTKLSYMQLFEPNAESAEEQPFVDAIHNLNVAADAGVQSALGVLAMMDLIGVADPEELEDPSIAPLTQQERQARGDRALTSLADANDFWRR